jgi:NAD/NADP transhydrogenase beta subunit
LRDLLTRSGVDVRFAIRPVAGFAGIDNELYYMDKTLMLFGDAKTFVASLVKEIGANHD